MNNFGAENKSGSDFSKALFSIINQRATTSDVSSRTTHCQAETDTLFVFLCVPITLCKCARALPLKRIPSRTGKGEVFERGTGIRNDHLQQELPKEHFVEITTWASCRQCALLESG